MTATSGPRRPRVFKLDDPNLEPDPTIEAGAETEAPFAPAEGAAAATGKLALPSGQDVARGIRWGGIFLSTMLALASLALTVWFARFVSVAVARDDWIGWTAFGLLVVGGFAALMLVVRELIGLLRLGRLGRLKADIDAARLSADRAAERKALDRLVAHYGHRRDLAWSLARLKEHRQTIGEPGDLLALADRDLMAPLDGQARLLVMGSAKRVSVVTALSPMALIAVGYVLVENLRLLRKLATLYGGRPGLVGSLRLARMVLTHIVATGGVALTDDLVGQFLGQDLVRRLSRRLGEGVFNGALTARVGVAALDVLRPLPFIEARPVRVRDIVSELLRRRGGSEPPASPTGSAPAPSTST